MPNRFWEPTVGRTPWSAAGALAGLCELTCNISDRREKPAGGWLA
jgi:hypothetical protein